MASVPLLDDVVTLAEGGRVTGASARNWDSYGAQVRLAPDLGPLHRALLCDPQTSGGLLIACARDAVAEAVSVFRRHGFAQAAVIGSISGDEPIVEVGS